jgi:membrane associated rhomboid family serine protease
MTLIIIAITCVVSLRALSDRQFLQKLWFEPFVVNVRREWHRFFTQGFVHASQMHLFVNMFVLFMFGSNVENLFGDLRPGSAPLAYVVLYLGGVVFGALPGYRKHVHDPNYRSVGASGATSAVLFAYILMMPTNEVGLMFLPGIGIPGWLFGIAYLTYEWYQDKRGGDNVAHDAHFYGAVFGAGYTALLEPRLITEFGFFQGLFYG